MASFPSDDPESIEFDSLEQPPGPRTVRYFPDRDSIDAYVRVNGVQPSTVCELPMGYTVIFPGVHVD